MRFISTIACEKVIIDKGGAHTLIEVLSGADIAITPPPGMTPAQLPANALSPKPWWIFSMWEPDEDDEGQEFEQIYVVYWPNGDKLVEGKSTPFTMTDRVQYSSYQLLGFPVGQQGKVRVSTWITKNGNRVTDPFDYFITIRHVSQDHHPKDTPFSIQTVLDAQ
ncbi:MAG TPA: hypothetical protein VGS78_14180 [Candidatus Sulfotelmatobacter sp.]|nr:hypothetical protein [Candidatus Sulfotelmatobacter sp.]